MTASAWDKFLLLSWKNWIIQLRHPIQTVFEVLVPVFVCTLLIVIRGLVDVSEVKDDFRYLPLEIDELSYEMRVGNFSTILAYSPENEVLGRIVQRAADQFEFSVIAQENAVALQGYAMTFEPFASIEFEDSLKDIVELPAEITYALRFPAELRTDNELQQQFAGFAYNWGTNFKFGSEFTIGPRNPSFNDGGAPPGYINQGFIQIQNAIDKQIIHETSNLTLEDLPKLFIRRFPYPSYVLDIVGFILEFALPSLFLIGFLYNNINIIKYITIEKELQLKEAMKIMGLPSYMHWIAWFTKCMIFQLVIISIITGMFKIGFSSRSGLAVLTYADWTVVWVFLFLYVMAAVTYSFMFSTFFNRANIAAIAGAVGWFVLLFPYNLMVQNYDSIGLNVKLIASLLCNTGMGFGFRVMTQYETAGVGVQWSNVFQPISPDDDLALGYIMIVLFIASILQMTIALYVEKIKPGEFGVPEKFYFPFTIKFWTGRVKTKDNADDILYKNNSNFEREPSDKKAGIEVRGLKKVYEKKLAVNNLSLNMYEDQITVLLGHNGAGKSTTMSMLTGLIPPSAGTAYIDGKDIRSDINSIRGSLGLCPQHNVLFNELTVKEHITFFSKLKGIKKPSDIDEQIRKYVELLELTPKLNEQSKTLSGGMKRKLSIGIALCGDSKIVMCDEPTSGMDPAARRALWDLLIKEKKGRTILLTTHFMDEADVLGDRIAIMADGDLKTVGSSYFLKKKFGAGYRLVCVKAPNCNPEIVTNLLSKYIPDIQIETNIGSELTFVLNEDYVSQFKTIFAEFESKSVSMKISSFGVSLTTLEEVFIKVGTDSNALSNESAEGISNESNGSDVGSTDLLNVDYSKFEHGFKLIRSQIKAMAMKRSLYTLRNYILLIIQFLIPPFFIVITMLSADILAGNQDLPALAISFNEYLETVTTIETGDIQSGSIAEGILTKYKEAFEALPDVHELNLVDSDFENEILRQYEVSTSQTNLKFMVGATFTTDQITAWFNNQAYHTTALTINLINNALLRSTDGNDRRSINVINKPLPFTTSTRLTQLGAGNNLGFNIAFNVGFGISFVTAMFVLFYIKERVSRAKLLQFVSGANKIIFWMTSFVIDYLQFFLISILFIVVLGAYQKDGYSTYVELARNFLLMVVFGFSVLPFTYVLSFMFKVPSTGLVRLSIGYIISGVFFFMAYFILNNELFNLQYIAEPLGWTFFIFPHYSLARGMSNLNIKHSTINLCEQQLGFFPSEILNLESLTLDYVCEEFDLPCENADQIQNIKLLCDLKSSCCDRNIYSFSGEGIGTNLVALVLVGILSFLMLFAMEYRWLQNIYYYLTKTLEHSLDVPESEDGFVDSDVLAEKIKIRSVTDFLREKCNLLIKDFTKYYGKRLAVNQICVAVDKAECFGLLGVNGAGKTSTFKMLTGDESISSGEAWVYGLSVKKDMNKVHRRIGYCPQFDALFDDLTGRETLKIFALLRGIPSRDINQVCNQLAEGLSFTKHLDKRVKAYSGGNKRKLSTALSLIGDPTVIYLDEPTSGMDVGARRQLWNMVIKARNSGKSVILTSHSMEECEVLCTRLAIMVNGEFKCLGSTQHLKNKFSKGFFLTIKVGDSKIDNMNQLEKIINVKTFVTQTFSSAVLKEEYMDIMKYHIPTAKIKWSQMFGLMEDAKMRLGISGYSLGQTSLEQVFLFFTKYQRISK
ncbi:CLUMA_CG003438, isoform A [Clunio marinus]|uniref:CLUMA_CG003438, isoform A n=1 Tax=Clunio marinus TaxID=568069 RepID=A0A1J1HUH0_9DIPT|nr:CLUMA_CG003438, isoform A [Clunio marinus]